MSVEFYLYKSDQLRVSPSDHGKWHSRKRTTTGFSMPTSFQKGNFIKLLSMGGKKKYTPTSKDIYRG